MMRNLASLTALLVTLSCTLPPVNGDNNPVSLPVIGSFEGLPSSITSGQESTLQWTIDGASSLFLDQGIGEVTGKQQIVNPNATTVYTITATNSAGSVTASTTIYVSVDANTVVISIDANSIKNRNSKKLLGVSFDARSSLDMGTNGNVVSSGYHDPTTGNIITGVSAYWNEIPLMTMRYPGNAVLYNWNWKYTIGPLASRTAQVLAPNLSKTLAFGFDEFMTMIESRGLSSSEVQIMVNIYPIAGETSAAQSAADWVEYCNALNDGSNPGGGTDWAAKRPANGHSGPYAIKIWNIGNEPWGPKEMNFDSAQYLLLAPTIIDAMKRIDPTIKITLPAVGDETSNWNQSLFNSADLSGKFYGLSPHIFYDEDSNTGNPGILQIEPKLTSLASFAATKGIVIIVGDHANDAPTSDPDEGFRWQGALATADFLMMVSQIQNIDLANFWIYGNPKGAWHPIRVNVDGSFTTMAVAQLYQNLLPVLLDQSVLASAASAASAVVTGVRVSAFQSSDALKINVVAVNIDLTQDLKIAPPQISGYELRAVKKLSGNLKDDQLTSSVVTISSDGTYLLSKTSVLLFECVKI